MPIGRGKRRPPRQRRPLFGIRLDDNKPRDHEINDAIDDLQARGLNVSELLRNVIYEFLTKKSSITGQPITLSAVNDDGQPAHSAVNDYSDAEGRIGTLVDT